MANLNISEVTDGSAQISDMAPTDLVIKFLLDNKIQRGVIDEVIERGFDSLEAFSLMAPEDITSPRIPVGQRRLLLYIAKSLGSGSSSQKQSAHIGTETSSTSQTQGSGSIQISRLRSLRCHPLQEVLPTLTFTSRHC